MEDTLPWKIIFIATFFSLLVLGFAYYLISPRGSDLVIESNSDKTTEFKNVRVAGRKDGKKVWEVFAQEGRLGKNRETSELLNIKDGKLYKDGVLEVSGLSANILIYYPQEKTISLSGEVNFKIENKSGTPSIVKCRSTSFYEDIEKEILLKDALEIKQGNKIAVAQEGIYSRKNCDIHLKRSVKAVFEKAKAVIKEKTAQSLKNPEAKKILNEKTFLTCDELIFSTSSGNAQALGSVQVSQKEKEARSEQAIYDDQKEILVLTGDVYLKKGDQWIRCQRVIVSVINETFEAEGSVEAELRI